VGAAGACTALGVREGYQAGGHDASLLHMRGDPEAMASTFARAILLVDSLLAEGTLTPRQARKLRFLCMWQKPPLAVLVGVRAREGRARRGDGGRKGKFGVMCPSIEYRACMPDNLNKTRIWPQRENCLSRSMLACLSWRLYWSTSILCAVIVCMSCMHACMYTMYACMYVYNVCMHACIQRLSCVRLLCVCHAGAYGENSELFATRCKELLGGDM
jgi:hypothetical protein